MRRIQSYGPSLVVLMATVLVLMLGPVAVQRMHAARASAIVTLAQQRLESDEILERINTATRAVAQMVEPSVVYIEANATGSGGRRAQSKGSGWIYSDDGYVITNAHVVAGMQNISVQFSDGRLRSAQVIGFDASTDIAVIKVAAGGIIGAQRATNEPIFQGDRVFAFGSPFGFKFSMSEGIVSGLGRHAAAGPGAFNAYTNYIQTDAAINPGNSGGPLVDIKGRVVGMNTAIVTSPERSGADGSEVTGLSGGIGFAIPLETIEAVANQLIDNGEVLKGYLGVALADPEDLNADQRMQWGLTEGFGVLITGVQDGLPAADAGLLPNDLIVRIDGEDTPSSPVLRSEISNRTPGEFVTITVRREGELRDFRVRLAAAKFLPSGQLVPVIEASDDNRSGRSRTERPF